MKKDIKDYLHLYLGCEVKPGDRITEAQKVLLRGVYTFDADYKVNICRCQMSTFPGENVLWLEHDDFKLILRPLSDMTEEEETQMIATQDDVKLDGYPEILLKADSGETVRFMLSKGFDLFGLIEAGLAIDKTKIAA